MKSKKPYRYPVGLFCLDLSQNLTIMSKDKVIQLQHFRYQLLPIQSDQQELWAHLKDTPEELIQKKNQYFAEAIGKLEDYTDKKKYAHVLHLTDDDHYILKIGQRKSTTLANEKLQEHVAENWPFCYVIIDNDPNNQKMVISENIAAFSTPAVLSKYLASIFKDILQHYGLNIEIEPMFERKDFWRVVRNQSITRLNFTVIRPNMARISKSLPKAFRAAVEETNSHKSVIAFNAPEKGVLENINEQNESIDGLVQYAAEGGGHIKIKMQGKRKMIDTAELPVKSEVTQIELEGSVNALIKFFKELTKL